MKDRMYELDKFLTQHHGKQVDFATRIRISARLRMYLFNSIKWKMWFDMYDKIERRLKDEL